MLKKLHSLLLNWKPIHLCWWFEKHGWEIPKYFIGGGSGPELIQHDWVIGDDDNIDPDGCTWDDVGVTRTGQAKREGFMVRVQIVNDGTDNDVGQWQLYYNDTDNAATAVQVGTALDLSIQVDSKVGTPFDGANTNVFDVIEDQTVNLEWTDGEYDDVDGITDKHLLLAGEYTDHQWCVQFTSLAADEQTYYFFVRFADGQLDTYSSSVKVTTAAGAGNSGPKGPLVHPLKGPFRGPI